MSTATTRRVVSSSAATKQSLADIVQGGTGLPSRIVLHGQGGVGKTSFAAQTPSPLFLLSPGETGLHTLIDGGLLPPVPSLELSDWESLLGVLEELRDGDQPYKTLVIDTLDGCATMANQFVCMREFNGDWGEKGFVGYQRGYQVVANGPWKQFLMLLDAIRRQRRMGILLLSHTAIGTVRNPEGPDYDRFIPNLHKDAWALTHNWADIVLFAKFPIVAEKKREDRRAKGRGGSERVLICEHSASADAKNRSNLPAEIDMGDSAAEAWTNFSTALKAARAPQKVGV